MCTYNAISSQTDHFEIQERDSEESLFTFKFSKSVSQLFNIRNTINV